MSCSLPAEHGVPLSRWSSAELAREAVTRGICEQISGVTVWRWLSQDAIKPWQHRSWIFPRDPLFAERAGPILDLYAGSWQGERLHPGDYIVCADEKPSIQARKRIHTTLPAWPGGAQKVEHEYERKGALCYGGADVGERILVGQRVDGRVRVTDEPAAGKGRRYLSEAYLESNDALDALIADYVEKARRLGYVPMHGWF
jgi:hypothetical protein